MNRQCIAVMAAATISLAMAAALRADVKTEEKNQIKMEGMMGRMLGMFGGKAAKEGLISRVAVKGNRKMKADEITGEIVDLDEEKIYELDMKKKSYRVTTFEEMRRRLKEAQQQAAEPSGKAPTEAEIPMEFDISAKETGQSKTINGYDCREVVVTVTAHEKGKTLEEGGGLVMTSHVWLAPDIPALKEIAEFDMRYARALGDFFGMGAAEQMAMAAAMYPGMKDMIGKMQAENVNMKGAAILTQIVMESVQNPAKVSREPEGESESAGGLASVSSIGGMLGRRIGRKKAPEGQEGKAQGRSTIMTVHHEVLRVSTDVSGADLEIPAGFKEKK
jgi:hypothetical protein